MKRKDYISFDTMCMTIAAIASYRSKDPNTQNGCYIVDENYRPKTLGYNGFPRDCSDDLFPWTSPEKYDYAEHAERNAIYNTEVSLEGCTAYLFSERGYYPCSDCARGLIQKGIRRIVMACAIKDDTEKYSWEPTKKMLDAAGIELTILDNAEDSFLDVSNKLKHSSLVIHIINKGKDK